MNSALTIVRTLAAEISNLPVEDITADTILVDDLGMDSLDVQEVIMGVDERSAQPIDWEPFLTPFLTEALLKGIRYQMKVGDLATVLEQHGITDRRKRRRRWFK